MRPSPPLSEERLPSCCSYYHYYCYRYCYRSAFLLLENSRSSFSVKLLGNLCLHEQHQENEMQQTGSHSSTSFSAPGSGWPFCLFALFFFFFLFSLLLTSEFFPFQVSQDTPLPRRLSFRANPFYRLARRRQQRKVRNSPTERELPPPLADWPLRRLTLGRGGRSLELFFTRTSVTRSPRSAGRLL